MTATLVRDLVRAAVRAPSSHNTQPWLFAAAGRTLELYADRTRRLPVNDPHNRELTISCGAALLTIRVAAARHRVTARVDILPAGPEDDLLARVHLLDTPPPAAVAQLAALFPAITGRRTHRGPFTDEPVAAETVARLIRAAHAEGAQLHVVPDDARATVAALVEQGDRAQFADRRWRRELAHWMRPTSAGDGLAVPLLALPATRLVVSTVDLGRRTGARDAELARTAPLLAALSTPGDTPADWLAAGQALQRLLLEATGAGMFAGYLNQPCQVGDRLRERLAGQLDGAGCPQVLLRVGHLRRPPPAAARRPLDAVWRTVPR